MLNNFLSFLANAVFWAVVYLTPVHPFLITIYVMLIADLITGVSKSIKLNMPITSKRLRDSVLKFIFYSMAVILSYQLDKTIISDKSLFAAKMIGGYIMLIEFQSNIENISEITGVNLWIMVKEKIMQFFNSKINGDNGNQEQ